MQFHSNWVQFQFWVWVWVWVWFHYIRKWSRLRKDIGCFFRVGSPLARPLARHSELALRSGYVMRCSSMALSISLAIHSFLHAEFRFKLFTNKPSSPFIGLFASQLHWSSVILWFASRDKSYECECKCVRKCKCKCKCKFTRKQPEQASERNPDDDDDDPTDQTAGPIWLAREFQFSLVVSVSPGCEFQWNNSLSRCNFTHWASAQASKSPETPAHCSRHEPRRVNFTHGCPWFKLQSELNWLKLDYL